MILHEHHLPIDVERFTMEFVIFEEKNYHASFLRTYSLTLSHLNEWKNLPWRFQWWGFSSTVSQLKLDLRGGHVFFSVGRKNGEPREKPWDIYDNQTQHTCDIRSKIQTTEVHRSQRIVLSPLCYPCSSLCESRRTRKTTAFTCKLKLFETRTV